MAAHTEKAVILFCYGNILFLVIQCFSPEQRATRSLPYLAKGPIQVNKIMNMYQYIEIVMDIAVMK